MYLLAKNSEIGEICTISFLISHYLLYLLNLFYSVK